MMRSKEIQPLPRRLPTERKDAAGPPAPWMIRAAIAALSRTAPDAAAAWLERLYFHPRRHRPPTRELELRSTARPVEIVTEAGTVSAYVWEDGDTLPWDHHSPKGSVLLVHGWEGRAAQLGSFVEPLVRAGWRVVGFDAPGHGSSAGEEVTIPDIAAAIRGVAVELGPFDAAIGHSLGAAALGLALAEGLSVERVALLASPVRAEPFAAAFVTMLGASQAVAERFHERLEKRFGGPQIWSRLDLAKRAAEIDATLLLIHDLDDREIGFGTSEEIAASWNGARLVATAGLGHRKILHDPVVVEEIARFIAAAA